ncbi:hypothetical protein [Amycolatopsis sp. lyj-108]|uniref:hypothetical protein n=1 Tax=Amycolatopsis sp. lyj-108 TaxID=2789286 RepID=UPI003978DB30
MEGFEYYLPTPKQPIRPAILVQFAEPADDVAVWLLYLTLATRRVEDDDLEDPDLGHYQGWYLYLLAERVGFPAIVSMVTDRTRRRALHERGPHFTLRRRKWDLMSPLDGALYVNAPAPITASEIDSALQWLRDGGLPRRKAS